MWDDEKWEQFVDISMHKNKLSFTLSSLYRNLFSGNTQVNLSDIEVNFASDIEVNFSGDIQVNFSGNIQVNFSSDIWVKFSGDIR